MGVYTDLLNALLDKAKGKKYKYDPRINRAVDKVVNIPNKILSPVQKQAEQTLFQDNAPRLPEFKGKTNNPVSGASKYIYNEMLRDVVNRTSDLTFGTLMDIGENTVRTARGMPLRDRQKQRSSATKIGRGLVEGAKPEEIIGEAGNIVTGISDLYGGGKVLGFGKKAIEKAGKQSLKQILKESSKAGFKSGVVSGAGRGAYESKDKNLKEQLIDTAVSGVTGGVSGAVISPLVPLGAMGVSKLGNITKKGIKDMLKKVPEPNQKGFVDFSQIFGAKGRTPENVDSLDVGVLERINEVIRAKIPKKGELDKAEKDLYEIVDKYLTPDERNIVTSKFENKNLSKGDKNDKLAKEYINLLFEKTKNIKSDMTDVKAMYETPEAKAERKLFNEMSKNSKPMKDPEKSWLDGIKEELKDVNWQRGAFDINEFAIKKKPTPKLSEILKNKVTAMGDNAVSDEDVKVKDISNKFGLDENFVRDRVKKIGFNKFYDEVNTIKQDYNPKNLQNYTSKVIKEKYKYSKPLNKPIYEQVESPSSLNEEVIKNKTVSDMLKENINNFQNPSIKTKLQDGINKIKSSKQVLEKNRIAHETVNSIQNDLAKFNSSVREIGGKYDVPTIEKMMSGEIEPNNKTDKDIINNIKSIYDEIADVEGLKDSNKYNLNYIPHVNEEQMFESKLKLKFLNSSLTDLANVYNSDIQRTNKDFFGDMPLEERLTFRIYDSLRKSFGGTKLNPKESVIYQLQKDVDKNTLIPFDKRIGIFQNTKIGNSPHVKDFLQSITSNFEQSSYGWDDIGIWDSHIRPILQGQFEIPNFTAQMMKKYKNGENLAELLSDTLGLQKGTAEYSDIYGDISKMLLKAKPEKKDKVAEIAIKRVSDEVFKNRPLTNLESWLKTHDIIDPDTKGFVDREVKQLLKDGYEETNILVKGVNYFRRLEQLATIGGKVSTAVMQPFETIRAWARYNPKFVAQAYKDAIVMGDKIPYEKYISDRGYNPLTGDLKDKNRIPQDKIDKFLSVLEDKGFSGMKTAERWKNRVFARASELQGIKNGLKGKELDDYVFDEIQKYAHEYNSSTLPNISKNPFIKFAFMFSTYPIKQTGLLLREAEKVVGGDKNSAKFLLLTTLGAYSQYKLFEALYKNKQTSMLDTLTGGAVKPYNPLFDTLVHSGNLAFNNNLSETDRENEKVRMEEDAIRTFVPFGNQAINVTGKGLYDINKGYTETPSGNVKYPSPSKMSDILRSVSLSRYATDEARKYYENTQPLGEKQSEDYKNVLKTDGKQVADELYNSVMQSREQDKIIKEQEKEMEKGTINTIKSGVKVEDIVKAEKYALKNGISVDTSILDIIEKENSNIEKYKEINDYLFAKSDRTKKYNENARMNALNSIIKQKGYTQEDVDNAVFYEIKNNSVENRSEYIIKQENPDFAKLYEKGILTKEVVEQLARKGYIKDEDLFWENLKMTDSYYRKKILDEKNKKYVKDILKKRSSTANKILSARSSRSKKMSTILTNYSKRKRKPKRQTVKKIELNLPKYSSPFK